MEIKMILNKENCFVGANVKYQGKEYAVVKMNIKTVYITQDKELSKKLRVKLAGTKTIDMIKSACLMVNFTDCEIDEKEKERKVVAEKVATLKSKQKKLLNSVGQRILDEMIKRIYDPKNKLSWKNIIDLGGNSYMTILVANKEKKMLLLSVDGNKYFYDIATDLFTQYNPTIHKNGYGDANIVWPFLG
jgi:hypothetical protein